MSKHSNTPELRFPEFDGEWEEKKLGAEVTFYSGLTYKPDDINFEGTFVLRSSNIKNGKLVDADNVYVDSNKISCTFVNEGDVIVVVRNGSRNLIGKHARVNTKLSNTVIGAFMTGIRCYNSKFINSLLDTNNFYREIHRNLGATINQITTGNFKKMSFYFPDDKEKEKIGEFFGKLDRQIELEEEKLELLEQQKKGYMQKIFSQELRFKDDNGNDYPNWENEKLGDLINEVNERTTSNNQYVLLSSTKNGLLSQEEYFKKQIGSKDSTGYKILRLNQLVLSPQNLWLGNINFNQRFDIGIVSPSYRIYNLSHQFDINFAKDLLKSPRYIYEYAQASEQGASVVRRNLNLELFYSIKISLPSIEEQRKIGAFLNKLDKLMRKQYNKIEVLKQRKQGLLQKMFV
ncbi:restriction endonuclease subunit S [Staphylococcus haemolyticus]|uniref:restriction endonuclease subunit S n=3 Tax=Staphylococcus TaxID=1279 RepID=UPI0011A1F686|nr:restriction endonuclease subunit S [Staphylococcus haemolyticus]